jgi:hypothetical protein
MESRQQIRQKEIDTTKNYSISEIKDNIIFYSFFRFLFSDLFTFIFIFIPLFFIARNYDFNMKVVLALILVQPVIFYINKPINKAFGIDKYNEELKILIEVNKEILKQKKEYNK